MKEEVKEIDITKDLYLCSPLLNTKCPKTSCYINNGSCCHTVKKKHSQKYLLDCITNLQEENENLKQKLEIEHKAYMGTVKELTETATKIDKAIEHTKKMY